MPNYPYGIQIAVAPLDENTVIRDGEVWIYDSSDKAGTTPLTLTDLSGLPLANPLRSNGYGNTRPFITTSPQVKWKSGVFEGLFESYIGLRDEAIAAAATAQQALSAMATSATAASAAADSAETLAEMVGSPPDTVIKALINTTSSGTRKALDALYAAAEPSAAGPGGGGVVIINSGTSGDSVRRPLIGARVGVGSANTIPDSQYFDALHSLETEMGADLDISNWYRSVGAASAKNFTDTIKAELAKYPNRKVVYVLEMDKSNAQFNREFDAKDGIYPYLVETLQAIKDSGYADRVILAPFHEGNGGGGSAGSIGSYAWHMYDTDLGQLYTPSASDWKTGTPYGPTFRLNTPQLYKQAFRSVVNLARSMGLPSKFAQWFLAANSSDSLTVDGIERMDMTPGYAGDDYVDIIGLSYYNRSGDSRYSTSWPQPGAGGLREFYNAFQSMTGNPLWICETGCAASNEFGDKGQWYSDLIKLVASDELPRIEGMIMFMQDSRRYDTSGAVTQGMDMKLESLSQKRAVGRAINAAKRVTKVNSIPPFSRNLLPLSVAEMTTLSGWTMASGVTGAISNAYTPNMDDSVNGVRFYKPAFAAGDTMTTHNVYRKVSKSGLDYKPNDPYVLTFWARGSYDGFRLAAGIRQDGLAATSIDNELSITDTWEQYVVPFGSQSDDPALTGWRVPNFNFGHNTNAEPAWFELAGLRLSRGSEAMPSVERRPRIRRLSNSANLTWNCESAEIFTVTMEQSSVLRAPTGTAYDGQPVTLRLTQGGVGGFSLNLHAEFYSSTPDPALALGPGSKTLLTFQYDGDADRWGLIRTVPWDLV